MPLLRTHNPLYARSEYRTQLAKMSFDKNFDLTAGVVFFFSNKMATKTESAFLDGFNVFNV